VEDTRLHCSCGAGVPDRLESRAVRFPMLAEAFVASTRAEKARAASSVGSSVTTLRSSPAPPRPAVVEALESRESRKVAPCRRAGGGGGSRSLCSPRRPAWRPSKSPTISEMLLLDRIPKLTKRSAPVVSPGGFPARFPGSVAEKVVVEFVLESVREHKNT